MTDSNTPPTSCTKPTSTTTSLNYKDAGVDIDAGNRLVDRIKSISQRTRRPEIMGSLGGFGALCTIPSGYEQPVLVSGTDGVGTKLKLAMDLQHHDDVGIDLVAMCVNDLIVCGAEPLFFLDYYATGKLNVNVAERVVSGIGRGCELAGCSLIGGETAEMPGMYQGEDYDLAGFCVGVVEKAKIIDGQSVQPGDTLIGLASSGAHSNGFSLIRELINQNNCDLSAPFEGNESLGQVLLRPTRIYVKTLKQLIATTPVKAVAHITGGGLMENLPRVLPTQCQAIINTHSWQWPSLFDWLQHHGRIRTEEMLRTFNCGVGMVVCVANADAKHALSLLKEQGETAWLIGHIESANDTDQRIQLRST